MKLSNLAAAAALALAAYATPALAAVPAVGTKIFGPDGGEVGTVESVQPGAVVINTGTVTAALPEDAFGEGANGPSITMNKADLEAAVNAANQEAAAALAAALVEGADVYSSDAVLLGKVKSLEGDLVVVELASGPASLPRAQVALQGDKVTFLATAADVAAATGQGGD
jgi:hypothetical protein